jgi:thiamine biosynthesis protein ThiS
MKNYKTFLCNGQEYYTDDNLTILDLLKYFNYNSGLLVLEYNSFICNKKNWDNILISSNDSIEIVSIVGGG